jgi:hypothetical protein
MQRGPGLGKAARKFSSGEHVAGFMGYADLLPSKDAGQGKMACRRKVSVFLILGP